MLVVFGLLIQRNGIHQPQGHPLQLLEAERAHELDVCRSPLFDYQHLRLGVQPLSGMQFLRESMPLSKRRLLRGGRVHGSRRAMLAGVGDGELWLVLGFLRHRHATADRYVQADKRQRHAFRLDLFGIQQQAVRERFMHVVFGLLVQRNGDGLRQGQTAQRSRRRRAHELDLQSGKIRHSVELQLGHAVVECRGKKRKHLSVSFSGVLFRLQVFSVKRSV